MVTEAGSYSRLIDLCITQLKAQGPFRFYDESEEEEEEDCEPTARRLTLTPISIKNNPFLKLIILEQTPLLTCFGFVTRQKWLVSRRINLRKALLSIDVGVKG